MDFVMPDLIENSMSTCNYRFMRIAVNNFTARRNMFLLNLVFTAYITKSELSFKLSTLHPSDESVKLINDPLS